MSGLMLDQTLLYKEVTEDTIPATPVCYALATENVGVKSEQSSENIILLGSGRGASKDTYGISNVAGGLPFVFGADNAIIFMTHTVGTRDTVAAATATDWVAATATAVGDIVNHSDNLHTLSAYTITGTGLTHAATEPDLSAYTTKELGRNLTIVDNEVTWIIMPVLYTFTGDRKDCLPSFGLELRDSNSCTGSSKAFTRLTGLYAKSLGLTLNGGTKGIKASFETLGISEETSEDNSAYITLLAADEIASNGDHAGSKVDIIEDFYSYDEMEVKLNGVTATKTTSLDITIDTGANAEDGLNNDKIIHPGNISLKGTLKVQYTTAQYKAGVSHITQNLEIILTKANGCSLTINLPQYEMAKSSKMFEVGKFTMLELPLNGYDTSTLKSINYVVTCPIADY